MLISEHIISEAHYYIDFLGNSEEVYGPTLSLLRSVHDAILRSLTNPSLSASVGQDSVVQSETSTGTSNQTSTR